MNIETIKHKFTEPWFPHSSIWPRWLRWIELQIRMKLFRQSGYFIDCWTIEEAQDVETQYGLDLEEEIAQSLIEEIEKEKNENGSYTWEELCERNKS